MPAIFVLEDNCALAEVITSLVVSLGHSCRAFNHVADFLNALAHSDPDLVLLDVWLTTGNALELYHTHKALMARQVVVLMSGGGGVASLEAVAACADVFGIDDMLFKPFTRQDLKSVLGKHLYPTDTNERHGRKNVTH